MPLHNRQNATMSGVCLEEITATFSSHPLQRVVEQDLIKAIIEIKERISKQLSKLLKFVGRDTDFMIGIRYLRYYSQKIFEQATGLTIYESKFKNIDGTSRIVGDHNTYLQRKAFMVQCTSKVHIMLQNISIATIQPIQNGISSKLRHLPYEH